MTKQFLIILCLIMVISCAGHRKKQEVVVEDFRAKFESDSYIDQSNFLKASTHLLKSEYEQANQYFEKLDVKNSNDLHLKKKYAISLVRVGKIEEGTNLFEKIYTQSNDPQIGVVLAGLYSSLDRNKEAYQTYQRVLSKDPSYEEACIFLSKLYHTDNKTNDAFTILNKCSKAAQKSGVYHYYIGKMHVDRGHLNKALSAFKESLTREPSFSRSALGIGLIYEETDKHTLAIREYKKFLGATPQDGLILDRLVNLLFAKQMFKEVIPFAEMLSDSQPENLDLKLKLGILYADIQDFQKAISTFKDLSKVLPDNDRVCYYLAAIYQENDQKELALEYYNRISGESELHSESTLQMAHLLKDLSKEQLTYEQSLFEHIDANAVKNKDLATSLKLVKSNYYEEKGLYKKAITEAEPLVGVKGFGLNHYFYLAGLYEKQKEFKKAYGLIEKVIGQDPNNAHAYNFIGYSLVEREVDLDKAYQYLQKAISLSPQDGFIKDSLGWYYFKKGKLDLALKVIEEAAKIEANDPAILKHLAIIYAKKNNLVKAKTYMKRALSFSQSDEQKILMKKELKALETKRLPASFK